MSTGPSGPFNILNLSLKTVNIVDMKLSKDDSVRIHGCVLMPSGELLLVNNYKGEVLHLDASFTVQERVKLHFLEIAVLSENVVVGSCGFKLEFVEVLPKLRVINSVPLGNHWPFDSRGIAVGGGLIYVSCYEGDMDKGHIRVLNSSGKEIRRIDAVQKGKALFDKPYHLAASQMRVYISGDALTCLKPDGTLVYQFKDERLDHVSGMLIDSEDNVLTCSHGSPHKAIDKFHVITADGKRYMSKALETSIDIPGWNAGDCLAFRPSDGTLVMGSFSQVYIFKTA